jgi:DNA-binding FadR family transcriptional regulator
MGRRYRDVMLELIDAVVGGEYAEGSRMPTEAQLRERFGASRGVLREALLALEERGLVAVAAGRGQIVRGREAWDTRAPEVLRACVERGPDPTVLGQAIDARAAVQRIAAEHVCRSGGDDIGLLVGHVDELALALDDEPADRLGAGAAFLAAEVRFHRTLTELSGNAVLANLSEPLHLPLAELRRRRAPERDRAVIVALRQIIEGLSSREPALADDAVTAYARQLRRWLHAGRGTTG